MKFLEHPPRFLFFTGKGGVGKTSAACATALSLAAGGKQVLLVSTDPASNVGQVFGVTIGNTITPIPGVPGLTALEIAPEQAAAAYRERIIAPVRGLLPESELASIAEGLSGSCTTEVASFDEFTNLLADDTAYGTYDHIVFDTAPTGHTIRLLQLPGSWTDFLDAGKGDPSCLGPLSGLEKHKQVYAKAVQTLTDPARTRLVLVARAQTSPLTEIERTFLELKQIGITGGFVVINGVLPPSVGDEPLAQAVRGRETAAIAAMSGSIAVLPRDVVELKAGNMVGIPALETLFRIRPRPRYCSSPWPRPLRYWRPRDCRKIWNGQESTRGPGSSTTRLPPPVRRPPSCRPVPPPNSRKSPRSATLADRLAIVPLLATEPIGEEKLTALTSIPQPA